MVGQARASYAFEREAPPPGLEPGTSGLAVRSSVQLRYGGKPPESPQTTPVA